MLNRLSRGFLEGAGLNRYELLTARRGLGEVLRRRVEAVDEGRSVLKPLL